MNLEVARGQPDNHAPPVNQVKNKHSVYAVEKLDRCERQLHMSPGKSVFDLRVRIEGKVDSGGATLLNHRREREIEETGFR